MISSIRFRKEGKYDRSHREGNGALGTWPAGLSDRPIP